MPRPLKPKICKACGKEINPSTRLAMPLCGWKCYKLWQKQRKEQKTAKMRKIGGVDVDRLRRKADKLLQQVYTKGLCEVCGQEAQCVHHVIYKSQSKALRYDPENLVPICNSCHDLHHKTGDARILGTIIAKRGSDWHNKLQEKRKEKVDFTEEYLQSVIDTLERTNS